MVTETTYTIAELRQALEKQITAQEKVLKEIKKAFELSKEIEKEINN
jgi:hypothetical protein